MLNKIEILIFSFVILQLSLHSINAASKDDKDKPVCYGSYGCFNKPILHKDWPAKNQIGYYPEPPEKQNVTFYFFSCEDRYNPTVLRYDVRDDEIRNLNYNPLKRTILMIHGYTDFYTQFNWMGNLKDHILSRQPCNLNVIVADWSKGAQTSPNYLQGASNTRLVGSIVASFITRLNRIYKSTNDHFTVLGHSLGGQVAGFTGKLLNNPKLRLIIGLDPAGPAFADVGPNDRLSPNDAKLVISVHTNGGVNILDGLGIYEPVAHYNFVPNGGKDQPGCEADKGITSVLVNGIGEGLSDAIACSHRRAYLLMAYEEQMFDDFETNAYPCNNYTDFEAGKCGDHCRDNSDDCKPFGRWFDYWQEQKPSPNWQRPIVYFVDTRDQMPYSYFFYQIKIKTGKNFEEFKGVLALNITGTLRNDFSEKIFFDEKFEPSKEYTYLHKSFKSLGRIVRIEARLQKKKEKKSTLQKIFSSSSKKELKLILNEIEINYMNGYSESKRKQLSTIMKNLDKNIITGNETITFVVNNSINLNNSYNNNIVQQYPINNPDNKRTLQQDQSSEQSKRSRQQSPTTNL